MRARCTNCNATLTWRDVPVIECDYCHEKVLVDKPTVAARAMAEAMAMRARGRPAHRLYVVVAIIGLGIIGQVIRIRCKKAIPTAAAASPQEKTKPELPDTGSLNDFALDRAGALHATADKVRKYEISLPAK